MHHWRLFALLFSFVGISSCVSVMQQPFFPPPPLSQEDEAAVEELRCCLEFPEELIANARAGDSAAQFEIGVAYAESGEDSLNPNPKAVQWLRMAANSGHAIAQNEIGVIYTLGFYGEEIDHGKAMEWFERAAAQGEEYAHFNLARYYSDGIVFERDDLRATEHYQTAALAGYGPAQIELSYRAAEGIGMARDLEIAQSLMDRTRNNYGPREFLLDQLQCEGPIKGTDSILVAEAVVTVLEYEVRKNSSVWSEEAYKFGTSIIRREGMTGEEIKAFWTQYLQSPGSGFDSTLLASTGIFGPDALATSIAGADYWSDPELAFKLFRGAARMAHSGAQYELATSYRDGRGTDINLDEARYWYNRAENSAIDSD